MPEVLEFKFDRTPVLERTPEEIEEDLRLQAEAAEKLSHLVASTPARAAYLSSFGAEANLRRELEKLLNRAAEGLLEEEIERLKTGIVETRRQYSDSLFWQGKFEEAVIFAVDPESFNEYRDFRDAFQKLDREQCHCQNVQFQSPRSAKGVSVPVRREIQRVFVGAIGKEVSFIKCEKCRQIFAATFL